MSFFNNSDAGEQSSSHMTNDPRNNRNPPALQSITSTQAVHQPDLWEAMNSLLPDDVRPGEQGDNDKPRLKVRWEGMQMFGWVDGAWKPAAYHIDLRERLILKDAEQPGAPVWRRGESIDYTSYSPLTRGWTQDPHSVKDRQGREVLLMPRPRNHWSSNTTTKPLIYEGLVVLDINNRPIQDFPGAPLTLESTENTWFLEGLRRCFKMTIWDLRYRMIPVRNSPHGPVRLQGYTHLTNRLVAWRASVGNKNVDESIELWHPRGKKRRIDDDDVVESSQQSEEDEEPLEELVVPTPSMALNDAAREPISYPYQSSSIMHMSMVPEQTSWRGNHLDIPTFPGANRYAQTTNTAPPEGIYSPGGPSNFAHQNIYAGAHHPFDLAPASIYPSLHDRRPEANIPAQVANTAPAASIYSSGYPSTFVPQNIYPSAAYPLIHPQQDVYPAAAYPPNYSAENIYTAPTYPYLLPNPNIYSSPYGHQTQIPTAPGFGTIPTYPNISGMAPPNLYTQPTHTFAARHDDFAPYQPNDQTVWEQNPPTFPSQSTQPVATAPVAPVLPQENINDTFSGSEADPFMGADWSSDMVEEWP